MSSPTPHDAPPDLPALRQMAVAAMLRSRTEGVTMPACMLAALLDLVEARGMPSPTPPPVAPDLLSREAIADLRRKAQGATPGPWVAVHGEDDSRVKNRDEKGAHYTIARVRSWEHTAENAAFIAAANPSVVLALLDALDALAFRSGGEVHP